MIANGSDIDFLLAPVNSDWSVMIKSTVTEKANRVMVATSAAADGYYAGGRWSFSILTPGLRYWNNK